MNNTKIFFISSDYIKKNTPVIDDVENTLITSHILESQNIDLQQCIGEDLYKHYVDALEIFNAGDDVETILGADYYELFDSYFKPFLIYQTVYYSFYDLYAKITAKGLVNQTSGNSHTADMKILENMRREYRVKAEHYRDSMIAYLNINWTLYPEYTSGCTECEETYVSGLYLGPVEW